MEDWIYVTKSSVPPLKKYSRHLYELWVNRHETNEGEKCAQFQRTLASELGVAHVELTTKGHYALELALKALGCTGEVITTPFISASSIQEIMNSGCTPVFSDIDLSTWTIDVTKVESLITEKTSAILASHVFGRVCDVEQIEAIAKMHNLRVIYDASHAYKVKVNGEPISQFGDCTIYNLRATKLLHGVEGTALATNNALLALQFELRKDLEHTEQGQGGSTTKMSEYHAAMGLCAMDYVDGWIGKRKELYERYVEQLKSVEGFSIPSLQPHVTSNYSYFPILLDKNREGLITYLREKRIDTRKYFYPLKSIIVGTGDDSSDNRVIDTSATPVASWVAERVLCLPLYADLTFAQVDKICSWIKEYVRMTSLAKATSQAPSDGVIEEITTG